jgi:hypothetical protein
MSYEPSHRKPPRQERWPNATPGEGWPAYQQDGGSPPRGSAAALAGSRNGYGAASATSNGYGDAWGGGGTTADGYGDAWGEAGYGDARYGDAGYRDRGQGQWADGSGYGAATAAYPAAGGAYAGQSYGDGFDGAVDGYGNGGDGYGTDGYGTGGDGYGGPQDYENPSGWDGYTQPGHEFTGPMIYSQPDENPALDSASSVLVAPDTMGEWWRAESGSGEARGHRGAAVGVTMGVLGAAVAIGVATLAAAFVRPQASPLKAAGGVIPATLKSHLMAHFGAHGQTMMLIGVVGLIAIVLGFMARRNVSIGVAGIAALGLLGAFVAVTRPESRASDVIPSAIGGLAGIVALLWLAHASVPVASGPVSRAASLRPADGGGRRRTR